MKLTVLGKYGPYAPIGGCTSGYYIEGNDFSVAFEMGAGVFSRLQSVCRPEKLSALIISHLHFDHISDLGVMNYYLEALARRGEFSGKIDLYLPATEDVALDYIRSMNYFNIVLVEDGSVLKIGGADFSFFEVNHPKKSFGFTVDDGNCKFLYSGDTDLCGSLEENMPDCDLALLDGAFLSSSYKPGGPHMSISCCAELAVKHNVRTLVTHHLPTICFEDYVKEVGAVNLCSVVKEGETYTIKR